MYQLVVSEAESEKCFDMLTTHSWVPWETVRGSQVMCFNRLSTLSLNKLTLDMYQMFYDAQIKCKWSLAQTTNIQDSYSLVCKGEPHSKLQALYLECLWFQGHLTEQYVTDGSLCYSLSLGLEYSGSCSHGFPNITMEILSCSDAKELSALLYTEPIYDDDDMEIEQDPKPRSASDIWVDINGIKESQHNGDFAITLPVTIQHKPLLFLVYLNGSNESEADIII